MGIFAGQVPAGPFYDSTKRDVVVPFFSGDVEVNDIPYVSTVTSATGDGINNTPMPAWYSEGKIERHEQAFGQQPVNKPPYQSAVATFVPNDEAGRSGMDNPERLERINGDSPVNTGLFGNTPVAPTYTATKPNS